MKRFMGRLLMAVSVAFCTYLVTGFCWSVYQYHVAYEANCAAMEEYRDALLKAVELWEREIDLLKQIVRLEQEGFSRSIEPVEGENGWYRMKASGLRGVK